MNVTKIYHGMDREDPNAKGLSKKAIEQELDDSLDLDTIALYQIHRYGERPSIRETLGALDDAVRRN